MCSEDTPAQNTDSVRTQLVDKHPAPPLDRGSVLDPQPTVAVEMTEKEVIRRSPTVTHPGDDQLQRVWTRTPFSTDWLRQLPAARQHSSASKSGAFWWQLDRTGEEIRRNTPHCGRLYSASHCRQMCQQLRHQPICRLFQSDPAVSRDTWRL